MKSSNNEAEKRIDHLADQFTYLLTRLDQLSSRVAALEHGKIAMPQGRTTPAPTARRPHPCPDVGHGGT